MTALTFPTNLYDGTGYLWDILGGGSILNGTYDAYDIGLNNLDFPSAWNARPEDDGREVVFEAAAVNGIQLTRKIYVPEDSGWARFLEIITNTTSTTVTYSLDLNTNLGSDGSTVLVQTSTGDAALDRNDRWIVTDDANGIWDPTMLHVFGGEDGLAPAAMALQGDNLGVRYDLRLAPGETQIIMHFASQNLNQATAVAKGAQLAASGADALVGMSPEEIVQVANFVLPVGSQHLGTASNDIINGSAHGDAIYGLSGDDLLQGLDGNDSISGGNGNDTLFGGAGDDILKGGAGRDTVNYSRAEQAVVVNLASGTATGQGADSLAQIENVVGSAFDDTLSGDGGDNRLTGGHGNDILDGAAGRDTVVYNKASTGVTIDLVAGTAVGQGNDVLRSIESVLATNYDDRLTGNVGANWLTGLLGNDRLDGGAGIDTASFSYAGNGVVVDLALGTASGEGDDVLIGIEDVVGSAHDDALHGNDASNFLSGLQGADQIYANGGDDTIKGDAGNDTLAAGAGNDSVDAGDGSDIVQGDDGQDTLSGGNGDDWLSSGGDADWVWADAGNDIVIGGAGSDYLSGGAGNDVLVGAAGDDTLVGDDGTDTADFSAATHRMSVSLELYVAHGDGADRLYGIENVTGSAHADTLWGNAANNILAGGAGDDVLIGGYGQDVFVFALGGGDDEIADHQVGVDQIDVRAFGFADFATLAASFHDLAGDTVVRFGEGSVLLVGVSANGLGEADFLIV
jgi:Ca2+-binding RTX toxin-like protein